jgi:hypothetical protein
MRRAALVVLVLVLAGCNYAPADGTATESVSPAPVPEDVEFPPGVDESGVVSPSRLADAHVDALGSQSFTLVSNRTVRDADGRVRSHLEVTVAVGENRSYLADLTTAGPEGPVLLGRPPARGVYWSDGSDHARKLTRRNETSYDRIDASRTFAGSWLFWTNTVAYGGVIGRSSAESFYRSTLRDVPAELAGQRTENGTTVVRLVGDRAGSTDFSQVDAGDVRDVRLEAVVDERGLVRSFRLSYEAVVDGDLRTVDWEISYERVGNTSVSRPDWFDRAR